MSKHTETSTSVRSARKTRIGTSHPATSSTLRRGGSKSGRAKYSLSSIGLKLEYRDDMIVKGTWDPKCQTISINKREPKAGQLAAFIHEAMHAADDGLIGAGALKRRTPHSHIQVLAPNIALLLVLAGYAKMTPDEFVPFYMAKVTEEKRRGRRSKRAVRGLRKA